MRNGLSKQALGTTGKNRTQISGFMAEATQTARKRFRVFPELEQYANRSARVLRTNSEILPFWRKYTVVCFLKASFCQSKHLQMAYGLKFTCCCQTKKVPENKVSLSLSVNTLLGYQWKVYALQFLR